MSYEQRLTLAQAELDGLAGDEERRVLEDDPGGWIEALEGLLRVAERELAHVRSTVHGPERRLVLEDFGGERDRVAARLDRLRDAIADEQDEDDEDDEEHAGTGTAQLQLSWGEGVLIAWGGGRDAESDDHETLRARLASLGAPAQAWEEHEPVPLPDGTHAPALSTRLSDVLGWVASLQTSAGAPFVGPSVTWMALVTALGIRLAARGRVVPQLATDRGRGSGGRAEAHVTWAAGLVDRTQLRTLSRAMPGVVTVARQQRDPLLVTLSVLDATTDTICRQAAATVDVPAAPTRANSSAQLAEVVLAHLAGQQLNGQTRDVQEMHKALRRWARTVMGEQHVRLVLEMDEPDEADGGWELRTLASIGRGTLLPVEAAMSQANQTRRQRILRELERLERTYPRLKRGRIRGEVVLNQNEAWQLMSVEGRKLLDQGFDVRVPLLQKRKARVGLRLTAVEEHRIEDEGEKRSANDLHNVAWSVMLDDVEVDADEIRRLAAESRPMVRSQGRWVEVDHADLRAAAEALEEHSRQHRSMTGADMLRYALGLEEAPLGEVSIAGRSWATQLLDAASDVPDEPDTELDGFDGELRVYQAHANAWLEFLDEAGLGGILALDMGLGKTPTVLAHLTTTRHRGPSLAIVPPAVAGNWAREARAFVPGLEVLVHHGQGRAEVDQLPRIAEKVDLLITTYGTALRDIEGLEQVRWGKVVVDEAQVIKNHTSETAQQLRRLDAHGRIALTGTPIENGLGDLWALLDFCNPGLVGDRTAFMSQLARDRSSGEGGPEEALRTLNGVLVFRRTKAEPAIAAELPERIDELDHCVMTKEQVGLYQAVLDDLVEQQAAGGDDRRGAVLAAITKLKQICNHPAAFTRDHGELDGRSGKLDRLHEILDTVFEVGERALIFTHFATWGERLSSHLSERYGSQVDCYHGGLSRKQRDEMVARFQALDEPGAMVLSLKAGGTGLNLTAASHVILYDRWWNPAVEDQARDRVWRIGQTRTVVAHRLVCPGTVDERVEEVVQGKRRIADMVLPKASSVGDLDSSQLRAALGLDESNLLTEEA